MQRRQFLRQSTALFGAGTLAANCRTSTSSDRSQTPIATASATHAAEQPAPTPALDLASASWEQIKADFLLDPNKIHMSSFLLASHPSRVRKAIERHRDALDRDPPLAVEATHHPGSPESKARAIAAQYIGEPAECIALTDSTTMGLGLLYSGLLLKPDDEIVASTHQHFATEETLRIAAGHHRARMRTFDLIADPRSPSVDEFVTNVRAAIGPQTRVLALTWVDSLTGVRIPAREIADVVAEVNRSRNLEDHVIFCLDCVHGFGVEGSTVDELGCDFLSAGCHKWLLGPRGTGILYGRKQYWPRVQPSITAFERTPYMMWTRELPRGPQPFGEAFTPGGFHSFEHRWALDEAFAFHLELGQAKIRDRIFSLATRLKEGLAPMQHVQMATPKSPELSAGIVAFNIEGMSDENVVARLAEQRIVASLTPSAQTRVRLAPSLVTLEHEVDACIEALHGLRA